MEHRRPDLPGVFFCSTWSMGGRRSMFPECVLPTPRFIRFRLGWPDLREAAQARFPHRCTLRGTVLDLAIHNLILAWDGISRALNLGINLKHGGDGRARIQGKQGQFVDLERFLQAESPCISAPGHGGEPVDRFAPATDRPFYPQVVQRLTGCDTYRLWTAPLTPRNFLKSEAHTRAEGLRIEENRGVQGAIGGPKRPCRDLFDPPTDHRRDRPPFDQG